MKIIPLLRVSNLKESISFYTTVLDFELTYPDEGTNEWGTDLIKGEAEMQLGTLEGSYKSIVNVRIENIDALFQTYVQRGLDTSAKKDSPVHQGPLDQSWGTREFYVTDPDGNTLRFCQRI